MAIYPLRRNRSREDSPLMRMRLEKYEAIKPAAFYIEQEGKRVSPKIVLKQGSYELTGGEERTFLGKDLKTGNPKEFKRKTLIVTNKDTKAKNVYYLDEDASIGSFSTRRISIGVCQKGKMTIKGHGGAQVEVNSKRAEEHSGIQVGPSVIMPVIPGAEIRNMKIFLKRLGEEVPRSSGDLFRAYIEKKEALKKKHLVGANDIIKEKINKWSGKELLDWIENKK